MTDVENPSAPKKPAAHMDAGQWAEKMTETIVTAFTDFMIGQGMLNNAQRPANFDLQLQLLSRNLETGLKRSYEAYCAQGGGAAARPAPAAQAPLPKAGGKIPSKLGGQPQPPKDRGGRKQFLLRLVAGKFSHLFTAPRGAIFPRSIVAGFDSYLQKLLGEILYNEMNEEAANLLDRFETNDDKELWEQISQNEHEKRFAYNILIRILLKFENFDWARKNFISIVNNVTERESNFVFEPYHFTVLFNTLFVDIFRSLADDDERVRLDFMFGNDTVEKTERIRRTFLDYKLELQNQNKDD